MLFFKISLNILEFQYFKNLMLIVNGIESDFWQNLWDLKSFNFWLFKTKTFKNFFFH
jgi:hypothetical protein